MQNFTKRPSRRGRPKIHCFGSNAALLRRRAAFINAFNANPLNFLPGAVVYKIYRQDLAQSDMERVGNKILADHLALGIDHRRRRGLPEAAP